MQVICLQLNIFHFFKLEKKNSGLLDLNYFYCNNYYNNYLFNCIII